MTDKATKLGNCFLITPIGAPDSSDRFRVNQWTKLIYEPAIKGKYKTPLVRADLISVPGTITKQIIDHIIDAELVIVDFTPNVGQHYPNANVMYEAAIRHIAHKPVIHIVPQEVSIPFDIKDFRCISYNREDLTYFKKLKKEIVKSIEAIQSPGYKSPEIIGQTFDLERIVSDPKKFIEILMEKFPKQESGNIRIEEAFGYGPTGPMAYSGTPSGLRGDTGISGPTVWGGFGGYSNPVCPICGGSALKVVTLGTQISYAGTSQRYKCNECGTTFYK